MAAADTYAGLGRAELELGNATRAASCYLHALALDGFAGGVQLLNHAFATAVFVLRESCLWEAWQHEYTWLVQVVLPVNCSELAGAQARTRRGRRACMQRTSLVKGARVVFRSATFLRCRHGRRSSIGCRFVRGRLLPLVLLPPLVHLSVFDA